MNSVHENPTENAVTVDDLYNLNNFSRPHCIDPENVWFEGKDWNEKLIVFRVMWSDHFNKEEEMGGGSQERKPIDPNLLLNELKEMIQEVLAITDEVPRCNVAKSERFYRTAARVYNSLDVQLIFLDDEEDSTTTDTDGACSNFGWKKALENEENVLEDEWSVLTLIIAMNRWDLIKWFLRFHSAYALSLLIPEGRDEVMDVATVMDTDERRTRTYSRKSSLTPIHLEQNAMTLLLPSDEKNAAAPLDSDTPLLLLLPPPSSCNAVPDESEVENEIFFSESPQVRSISSNVVLEALKPLVISCIARPTRCERCVLQGEEQEENSTLEKGIEEFFTSNSEKKTLLVVGVEAIINTLHESRCPQHWWNHVLQNVFHGRLLPVCETVSPRGFTTSPSSATVSLFLPFAPQETGKNYCLSMWLNASIQAAAPCAAASTSGCPADGEGRECTAYTTVDSSSSKTSPVTASGYPGDTDAEKGLRDWYSSLILEPFHVAHEPPDRNRTEASTNGSSRGFSIQWIANNFFSLGTAQELASLRTNLHLIEVLLLSKLLSPEALKEKIVETSTMGYSRNNWKSYLASCLFSSLPFILVLNLSGTLKENGTKREFIPSSAALDETRGRVELSGQVTEMSDVLTCTKMNSKNFLSFFFSMLETLLLSAAIGVGEALHFHHPPFLSHEVGGPSEGHSCLSHTAMRAGEWINTVLGRIQVLFEWLSNATFPSFSSATEFVQDDFVLDTGSERREKEEKLPSVSSPPQSRKVMEGFHRFLTEIPENQAMCFTELWLGPIPWSTSEACRKFEHRAQLFYSGMIEDVLTAIEEREERRKKTEEGLSEKRIERDAANDPLSDVSELWVSLMDWIQYWKDFLGFLLEENKKRLIASSSVSVHSADSPGADGTEGFHYEENIETKIAQACHARSSRATLLSDREEAENHMDMWAIGHADSKDDKGSDNDCRATESELMHPILQSLVTQVDERLEYGQNPLPALYHALLRKRAGLYGVGVKEVPISHTEHHQVHLSLSNAPPLRLEETFERTVGSVAKRIGQESDATKLLFYGLYKQATTGDITIPTPWIVDRVGRAKWSAWNQVKGLTKEEAMKRYVDEYRKLLVGRKVYRHLP